MTPVYASATVDPAEDGQWKVTVTGRPPHYAVRVYTLVRASDNLAAQEGIRLFVEEMEGRARCD